MSLKQEIDNKMKEAMKSGDSEALSLFRMLKSAITNAEIEKKDELKDEDVLKVLEKQAKQRKDSIEQYEAGGRAELAEHEKKELAVIEQFLPEKMGEDDVRAIVKKKIESMPNANFGQVMGAVMGELGGQADGATVQKVVKEELES